METAQAAASHATLCCSCCRHTCSSMPVNSRTGTAFLSTLKLAQAVTHPSGSLASPEGAMALATDAAASLIYTQCAKRLGISLGNLNKSQNPKQGSGTARAGLAARRSTAQAAFSDTNLDSQASHAPPQRLVTSISALMTAKLQPTQLNARSALLIRQHPTPWQTGDRRHSAADVHYYLGNIALFA